MDPTDQNSDQPQAVKPDTLFSPSVPTQPPASAHTTAQTPSGDNPSPAFTPSAGAEKRKKIIIISAIVFGSIFLILIIFVLVSSVDKKTPQARTDQTTQQNDILASPSALDIENADNSISSDITGLDDDNDFPAANLSDENLQL